MASTKITELPSANTIAVTDVLPFVSDPSGSPITKKITANNLANSILTSVQVSVVPSSNVTLNLGSTAKNWNNVYIKTLYANGSVGSNGHTLYSNGSASYWASPTIQKVSVPANSTASGTTNQIAWDSNTLYICVSTNQWKKVDLTSF